jgi:hypothetical protein
MRIELNVSGADQVKAAFRSMSDELDKLNKKLDATAGKLSKTAGSAANSATSVSAGTNSSSTAFDGQSGSVDLNSSGWWKTPKPPVSFDNHHPLPNIPIPVNPSGHNGNLAGGSNPMATVAGLRMLTPAALGASFALTAVAKAGAEFLVASRAYSDFVFVSRGRGEASVALAGVSRGAGVGLDEAGQIAANKPGGANQMMQELEMLRKMPNDIAAAWYAKMRGIEGYRSIRNMSDAEWEASKKAGQTSDWAQRTNDNNARRYNEAAGSWTSGASEIWAGILAVGSYAAKVAVMGSLPGFIDELKHLPEQWKNAMDFITGHTKSAQEEAAKQQLDAAHMNADSANKIKDAVYGGGARTKGAIPAAWGWYNQSIDFSRDAKSIGAIL